MAALKKLEPFDGTGDVERFIDRFEFAIHVDEIPSQKEASYFAMNLNGPAFDVFKGMDDLEKKDVAKIKAVLRATYGVRRSAAWRAMSAFRIGSGEQLDSAFEELHKWAKILTTGTNPASSLATVAFVEALPRHIAQKVRVLCGQTATKSEVVAAAKDVWDDANLEMAAAVSQAAQPGRTRWTAPNNRSSNEENRHCYGCGNVGHIRRNCNAICSNCGGGRHTERFCRKSGKDSGEPSSAPLAPRASSS
jgi:hypothetical protein